MKKICMLAIILCGSFAVSDVYASSTYTQASVSMSSSADFVTSVEAQNQNGTATKYFKIMRTTNANGTYYFYAQDGNGTYDIQYADRNSYKPFYVKIGNERWYFACKELDRASGQTNQW